MRSDARRKSLAAEVEHVGCSCQRCDHRRVRANENLWVVALVKNRSHRPGKPLLAQRELCFKAGLVAAGVLAVPRPVKVHSHQAVQRERGAVIGEALVAEPCRDTLRS